MGRLFQDYVDQLMERAYASRSAGVYLTEQQVGPYRRGGNCVFPADGFAVEDGRIGVIECWSAPLSPVAITGDAKAFRQEIQRDLLRKLRQLDQIIRDLESGALNLPGGKPAGGSVDTCPSWSCCTRFHNTR